MSELILKWNSLDAFRKQELLDFLNFLVERKPKNVGEQQMSKIEAMKLAANDPLYLQDIKEIDDDFAVIDHETLWIKIRRGLFV